MTDTDRTVQNAIAWNLYRRNRARKLMRETTDPLLRAQHRRDAERFNANLWALRATIPVKPHHTVREG